MPKKPQITIRPPPPAAGVPTLAEEAGFRTPRTFKTSRTPKPARAVKAAAPPPWLTKRKDGRELRRVTTYLPPDLHRRIAVRCAELDIDVSAGLVQAAEAWLSRR